MAVKKKAGKHRVKKTKVKKSIKKPIKPSAKSTKKQIKAKKSNLAAYISLAVLAAVILAFGGFYGYRMYQQNRIDAYNGSVYEIQVRTQQKMADLDPLFQEFVAAPSYAKALAPKFKEAASVTQRTALALETLNPPNQYAAEHNKLVEMYEQGSKLYEDLFLLSSYINKREVAIKSLVSQLKSFASQMSDAGTRLEALEVAKKAQKKIENTLSKFKELKSPINVYDNKALVKYTEALNKHLGEFKKAAANNNVFQIEQSLNDIQMDFSQNWQKAFFSADKKAINSYDKKVKQIQALYEEISF